MKTRLRTMLPHLAAGSLLLLASLPGLRQVMANAPLRADTDTVAMLDAMRETGGLAGWWRWFTGDWFLQNGFYRPTTCLSLLIDYTLYGEVGWGYRLTNWLLALGTALGAYALLMLLAPRWLPMQHQNRWQGWLFATAGAVTLSLQSTGALSALRGMSAWWLLGLWMVGIGFPYLREIREKGICFVRQRGWQWWLGAGAFFWGWDRLVHGSYGRLIVWVPSRTALLATCLTVWAMYLLLRWGETGKGRFLLGGSILYAGALGAYEQPLMMVVAPLAMLLLTTRREERGRMAVALAVLMALAGGYLALRGALLPPTLSGYQQQQLRSNLALGVLHWLETLFPIVNHLRYWMTVGVHPYQFFFKAAWDTLVADLAFVGVAMAAWRWWRWFLWWWLWQAATYLPMSLLHPFEHYYYLPQVAQNALDLALVTWGMLQIRGIVVRSSNI